MIISSGYYPTISPRSFRTTELSRELARQGHYVKVIIPYQNGIDYSQLTKTTGVEFKDLGRERFGQLDIKKNKKLILVRRIINRLLLMFFEFPDIQFSPLVVQALKKENNYDLLISIAVPYPIHWGVAYSRSSKHRIAKTWVADCGDPYMGDRIDTFRKLFYFKYVEKWFCRKADYLSIPVKEAIEGYYREFHYKIRIIPQGFKFKRINFPEKVYNNPITFAYAGNIVPFNRDPRPFLDYLCGVNIDFRFIIYTKKIDLIINYKRFLKDKLVIRDYIPRDELLEILVRMDFLINFDNNTAIHSPSKLIDYALTRRPVLNITKDLDKSVISAFLNRDYSGAYKIEDIENYQISNVAGKFLKLSEYLKKS